MQIGRVLSMNQKLRASKAQVFNETIETYFDTTRSAEVKSLIQEIRSTDDADKRRQLKGQLPFRCPHYFSFKDGRRAQANIIPEEFTFQLTRTLLILMRASGRACCCMRSARHRASCIWTSVCRWA